ncbi:DNA glycosylase [Xylariaceae sp. FL0255]|nr:DNA glycosylase [Xylariaceae sp. FL0255]
MIRSHLKKKALITAISQIPVHFISSGVRDASIMPAKSKANPAGSGATEAATKEQLNPRRRSVRNAKANSASAEIASLSLSNGTATTTKRIHVTTTPVGRQRRAKRVKLEEEEDDENHILKRASAEAEEVDEYDVVKPGKSLVKTEPGTPSPSSRHRKTPAKDTTSTPSKEADLQAKKLKSYAQFAGTDRKSPYPDFQRPTPSECHLAHDILSAIHGSKTRPDPAALKAPTNRAGCGDSPSVLDALVRTILSQNTSDKNSTRAKLSMDKTYGGRSDNWAAIISGGQPKLEAAIQSGGLAATKSRVIISILEQVHSKYGLYSLDHLFSVSDDEAMREMLSFKGVGPKTASCVLLFCLRRASFAVDTHVHRITGLLGWRPAAATRDLTHAHLDARIPDELKYALHVLFVRHGKDCEECKAGGKSAGKCKLRKAFRKGGVGVGAVDGDNGEKEEEGLEMDGFKSEEEDEKEEKKIKDESEDENED